MSISNFDTDEAKAWREKQDHRFETDFIQDFVVKSKEISAKFDVEFYEEFKPGKMVLYDDGTGNLTFEGKSHKIVAKTTKEYLDRYMAFFEKIRDKNMEALNAEATPTPTPMGESEGMSDDELLFGENGGWESQDVYVKPQAKEKQYEIYSPETLEKKRQEIVKTVQSTLNLNEGEAKIVLSSYRWNWERISTNFVEYGKEKVMSDVGLSDSSLKNEEEDITRSVLECPICYDDVDISKTTALAKCHHRFCNACWAEHIKIKIQSGEAKQMTCMHYDCNLILDENIIQKFTSNSLLEKYEQKLKDSFVDDNKYLKWCPSAPHCGNAVFCKVNSNTPLEIECNCNHIFCFSCNGQPHLPASCNMIRWWEKKCKDDSETLNWINANTRDCPDCGKATEKNGGCNHISCTCGGHWCWKCGNSFNESTVYSHNCNGYSETDTVSSSRSSLKRYMHYFDRYSVHASSREFEKKTRKDIRIKMEGMYKYKPNSAWVEISWLQNALDVLFTTRRVLQYSYIFAYYIFDIASGSHSSKIHKKFNAVASKNKQLLFEDTQAALEATVEKLAHYLEMSTERICKDEEVKREIQSNTNLNETRMFALFDIIRKDLVEEEKYLLPDPPSVLSKNSF